MSGCVTPSIKRAKRLRLHRSIALASKRASEVKHLGLRRCVAPWRERASERRVQGSVAASSERVKCLRLHHSFTPLRRSLARRSERVKSKQQVRLPHHSHHTNLKTCKKKEIRLLRVMLCFAAANGGVFLYSLTLSNI